jgi:hypothetical protein
LIKFTASLPLLGLEYAKAKSLEIKYRLREIKLVLEYPNSKVSETIERLINDIEEPRNGRQMKITRKIQISKTIRIEEFE